MLSPKHAPPAIAQVVEVSCLYRCSLGLRYVPAIRKSVHMLRALPHEVPVATDKIAVTTEDRRLRWSSLRYPVTARYFTTDAPTPVDMNALAIAYANIKINKSNCDVTDAFCRCVNTVLEIKSFCDFGNDDCRNNCDRCCKELHPALRSSSLLV